MRKILILVTVILLLLTASGAEASQQIQGIWALEGKHGTTIVVSDGEAATIGSETVYTNQAQESQYDPATADFILYAKGKGAEAIEDGHISSVRKIVRYFNGAYDSEELDGLQQLTYLQDIKYTENGYRVIDGDLIRDSLIHRNLVKVEGCEAVRFSEAEDFIVLQFNISTGEVYELPMKEYDSQTGDFSVDFPCVGPYLIALKKDNAGENDPESGKESFTEVIEETVPGHGSISDLETKHVTLVHVQDRPGKWSAASEAEGIYTSQAVEDQYDETTAALIRLAKERTADTGHNGH